MDGFYDDLYEALYENSAYYTVISGNFNAEIVLKTEPSATLLVIMISQAETKVEIDYLLEKNMCTNWITPAKNFADFEITKAVLDAQDKFCPQMHKIR